MQEKKENIYNNTMAPPPPILLSPQDPRRSQRTGRPEAPLTVDVAEVADVEEVLGEPCEGYDMEVEQLGEQRIMADIRALLALLSIFV